MKKNLTPNRLSPDKQEANENSTFKKSLINDLIFYMMKKQILFLTTFVLVAFSALTGAYGQCDNALSPAAGKSYTYTVDVDPTGGTFEWYVTSDGTDLIGGTRLLTGGGEVIGGTSYNSPLSTTASVDIIWTAQAIANAQSGTNYYLVVKYTTSCSNNLKPWVITPINLFQILVENVDATGAALTGNICRAEVAGATINSSGQVVYDYGENAIYLKVTANNFTGNWTPTIDMTALNASLTAPQTITSIEWSLSTTFTGTSNFDLTSGVATSVVPDKNADNITSGTDEFIYIKIVVDHAKYEGIADQAIALNLSGEDTAGNADVDLDASCNSITPDPDNLSQTIQARPDLKNENPASFIAPEP